MPSKKHTAFYSRSTERLLLGVVTLILSVMALSYYSNIKGALKEATDGYADGSVIHLSYPINEEKLKKALLKGGYFSDERYVNFISKQLKHKIDERGALPNLGALNKNPYLVSAIAFAQTGTEEGKLRFLNSIAHLGMDSALYYSELNNPTPYPTEVAISNEPGVSISGHVSLTGVDTVSHKGILVKLERIYPQVYFDTLSYQSPTQTVFYARTDEKGNYKFTHLDPTGNYSVIAIKPGFEFGPSQGTASIKKDRIYNFTGKHHTMRLLDRVAYKQIKEDKIFTVRTPETFKKQFFSYLALFVAAFWVLHVVLYLRKYRSDEFILPLIKFILGIGIIVLYSIQDPLRDEMHGSGMAACAAAVLLFFAVLAIFIKNNPFNRFYHSRWFDPLHYLYASLGKEYATLKAPRGYTWLFAAIGLMLLLLIFGTGPEGSGVKVNLFGLQVTELSKYLMVIFFAAYFTANEGYFKNIPDNRWLTKHNLLMFALFLFLLLIYAVLGDLGPAIVLCLTFLFFYAFAKGEFAYLIAAVCGFGIVLWIAARFFNTENINVLPWIALAACIGTFLYAYRKKKHESVFFVTLIMASFILLATLPFHFTQRLADRNSMFANIWENELVGGDQVAHGVWALNSGGFLGQGLGKGFSNVMPAYHTDMILQSIGEELGIVALIAIFIAFGLLVYRCILAARRTGKPFMFYVMAGIAIATMLQLIIITAGTLGLLPLTGISVPFLSKGNAGLMVTLIAFLGVLIMSHERGDKLEMEYVKKHFDNVNAYAVLTFFTTMLIFIGTLIWYQIKSDTYITKPALVLNKQGSWQFSYNPRIGIMLREIKPGNIYDKNGVLLATSDKEQLRKHQQKLFIAGADPTWYQQQLNRNQKRYYPFGADLLFWLGDYNKEIAREESAGYAAEFRHFTALRGFEVTYTTIKKTSYRYKENKFLEPTVKESELALYDYRALASFIKAGKNSKLVDIHNKKEKDIWLSLDVTLNHAINQIIQSQAPFKNFRTSVIALNAKTGDVLASAINPAPSYKDLKLIGAIDAEDYRNIYKQIFNDRIVVPQDLGITYTSRPGSVVKIIDAYAAINQYGLNAVNFSFFVYPSEVIRSNEPSNENVDMRKAIVKSSNVYFIKLINEKKLEASLFNMYDLLGMNIHNRGGFNFKRPADYDSEKYFKEWNAFTSIGKNIYNTQNKHLINTRKRLHSHYSDLAWGQGELMATPLHIAKMTAAIANKDSLQPARFLYKAWNQPMTKDPAISITKHKGAYTYISSFMKEQSAATASLTGLDVRGKTGSPERDKIINQNGKTVRKRVTDAWYTFYVPSPKLGAPIAFAIRIEEIGNSEHAKELAVHILKRLKNAGYL